MKNKNVRLTTKIFFSLFCEIVSVANNIQKIFFARRIFDKRPNIQIWHDTYTLSPTWAPICLTKLIKGLPTPKH